MLVLLFGASGVGKSSVATLLVEQDSWVPVISWITRPERPDERFKVNISDRSYEELARCGKLWSDVEQNGHRYGLLTSEVRAAIDDPRRFYVLDYGLTSWRKYFANEKCLAVYVAAGSDATLTARLARSGRMDRLQGALESQAELEAWCQENRAVVKIVNEDHALEQAAAEIATAARFWAGRAA
ncbi:hypothetical protein [Piscinibacter defluvii]|uniref:hypothetical protein n=1 Tax=Piscinibacter defluvii TaxID=1796922 RepID=UPI000FDF5D9D|nr:hypothetical protein [Piscinibacter defluvii]